MRSATEVFNSWCLCALVYTRKVVYLLSMLLGGVWRLSGAVVKTHWWAKYHIITIYLYRVAGHCVTFGRARCRFQRYFAKLSYKTGAVWCNGNTPKWG